MAHHENTKRTIKPDTQHGPKRRTPHGTTLRRLLRREAPSTVGLLADEQDFAAMRRYRTFPFDDHTTYLHQVETLLKSLTAQGIHTTVALFDPEEYAEFCAESGLDADTGACRSRFTAEIAAGRSHRHLHRPTPDRPHPAPGLPRGPPGHLGVRHPPPRGPRRLRRLRPGHRTRRLRPGLPPPHPPAGDGGPGHAPPGLLHPHGERPAPGGPQHPPRRDRTGAPRRLGGGGVRQRPRGGHRPGDTRGSGPPHQHPGLPGPRPRLAPGVRRPRPAHRGRSLQRLLHRRRHRRARLPGIRRGVLRGVRHRSRPRGTAPLMRTQQEGLPAPRRKAPPAPHHPRRAYSPDSTAWAALRASSADSADRAAFAARSHCASVYLASVART